MLPIFCNQCYHSEEDTHDKFVVTSCDHIYCDGCVESSPNFCILCKAECTMLPINDQLPQEVIEYFDHRSIERHSDAIRMNSDAIGMNSDAIGRITRFKNIQNSIYKSKNEAEKAEMREQQKKVEKIAYKSNTITTDLLKLIPNTNIKSGSDVNQQLVQEISNTAYVKSGSDDLQQDSQQKLVINTNPSSKELSTDGSDGSHRNLTTSTSVALHLTSISTGGSPIAIDKRKTSQKLSKTPSTITAFITDQLQSPTTSSVASKPMKNEQQFMKKDKKSKPIITNSVTNDLLMLSSSVNSKKISKSYTCSSQYLSKKASSTSSTKTNSITTGLKLNASVNGLVASEIKFNTNGSQKHLKPASTNVFNPFKFPTTSKPANSTNESADVHHFFKINEVQASTSTNGAFTNESYTIKSVDLQKSKENGSQRLLKTCSPAINITNGSSPSGSKNVVKTSSNSEKVPLKKKFNSESVAIRRYFGISSSRKRSSSKTSSSKIFDFHEVFKECRAKQSSSKSLTSIEHKTEGLYTEGSALRDVSKQGEKSLDSMDEPSKNRIQ